MLTPDTAEQILSFVKQEPRTIQEISEHIGKSWVTTESYVKQIKEQSGRIDIKHFRQGTRAALKIAYLTSADFNDESDMKTLLFKQIEVSRSKKDFDFFDIAQFIEEKEVLVNPNRSLVQLNDIYDAVQHNLLFFSGNLSFLHDEENGISTIEHFQRLLKKNIRIKILCRVDFASLNNIEKLDFLLKKYPSLLEIRHCYQPLRGLICDGITARFREEQSQKDFKKEELPGDLHIFYRTNELSWVKWLESTFWKLWRQSIDYSNRRKQLQNYF
ncbi:MAG: hypothetical protein KC535_01240 [Nanoarchaeota archaeon]|nr:hypothetical protein [Nanoarchaeota archaeon]